MLAQVGAVSLPSDVLDKLFHREALTDQESQLVARMPAARSLGIGVDTGEARISCERIC